MFRSDQSVDDNLASVSRAIRDTVTAGHAPSVNDGAEAAMVIAWKPL